MSPKRMQGINIIDVYISWPHCIIGTVHVKSWKKEIMWQTVSDIASLMKIYMTLMEIYKLRNHMTGSSYSMSDVKFYSHMVLKVTSLHGWIP